MVTDGAFQVIVAAALVVPASLAAVGAAQLPSPDDGNGIVMMVHGHVQPRPTDTVPIPPAHEAVVTSTDGTDVVFHVIPYTVEDGVPVEVDNAQLSISPVGPSEAFQAQPNGDPAGNAVCEEETSFPGHEGPVEACQVFRIPQEEFAPASAVELELWFDLDGERYVEPYNVISHALLHGHIDGGPVTLDQADAAGGHPTPFVVAATPVPA